MNSTTFLKRAFSLCVIAFGLACTAAAQDVNDSVLWQKAEAAVKAAVSQAEKDPTRPVYHLRPPAQWMNDICGAIYYNGYYHAFYQYNPFSGDSWGVDNSLWAHAQSKDLVHWQDLPWAFLPMKKRGERRCNSGCVTLDGNGRPTIFYTFVPNKGKRHQWGLKPLDDDLIQWKRVSNAPLMAAGKNGIPLDVNGGWSDPFVFKSEGRTFVTFKSCGGVVCEAKDKELTQWEYAGRLEGVTGECPNFFPLQDKWVLIRSTHPISYIVGDFDAKTIAFRASGSAGTMDYGFGKNPPKDRSWTRGLYGTNTFEDEKGRRILLGWICGFKPKRGWNGCMSLPRILTLDKDQRLIQSPAPELRILRGRHRAVRELKLNNKEEQLKGIASDTMEILAEFEAGNAETFGLKVHQSKDGKSAVTIRYTNGNLNVAGTDVPLKLVSGKLRLHVFIDKSVLEVFINDGVTSVTRVNYPGEDDLGVSVFAGNGNATLKSLDAWEMKSIWTTSLRTTSLTEAKDAIPKELQTPNYRITKLEGIGYENKFGRQDPSNVVKVGDTYHVYTSKFTGNTPYTGVIGHATSTDGVHWKRQGDALTNGAADAWDNYGVLTPYIMAYKDKYFLYYTSSKKLPGEPWASRGPNNGRHIGLAIADSPNGPWKRLPEPILSPGKEGEWDSYLVDDAHVIVRKGRFWLYYKGGDIRVTADTTQWGLAIGDSPAGPFVRVKNNPLIGGHTVCIWPHREGVAALIDNAGPEKYTVQWSADGVHFKRAAKLKHVHTGCGPYDPDAFTNTKQGRGISWGVAQDRQEGKMCIVRFDVDLEVPQGSRPATK